MWHCTGQCEPLRSLSVFLSSCAPRTSHYLLLFLPSTGIPEANPILVNIAFAATDAGRGCQVYFCENHRRGPQADPRDVSHAMYSQEGRGGAPRAGRKGVGRQGLVETQVMV